MSRILQDRKLRRQYPANPFHPVKESAFPLLAVLGIALALAGCQRKQTTSPAAAHYEKGVQLARKGEMVEATKEWQLAIGMDPSDPRPYLALADRWEQEGRPDLALSVLMKLELARPQMPHLDCRIAPVLLLLERPEQALERAEKGVAAEPRCAVAHSVRGMALAEIGETKAAVTALETARQHDPKNERIALTLAQVLADAGRRDEAAKQVQELLRATPNSVDGLFMKGWLEVQTPGRGRDAEATLRRALSLAPDHPRSHAALGALLVRQKRFQEARPHLERARAARPEDPEIARDLAAVYRSLDDPRAPALAQEAAERQRLRDRWRELLRRHRGNPGDAGVTLELARVERERGDPEEALRRVRSVLQADPNHREALRLMHRLLEGG